MPRLILLFVLHSSLFTFHCLAQEVDATFDPKLTTVLLYPQTADLNAEPNPGRTLEPPVIDNESATQLMLEFDDLAATYRNCRARIVHCNADWQKSVLNDLEFTYEYNDNPITDYQISTNTKVLYYHYRFVVPSFMTSATPARRCSPGDSSPTSGAWPLARLCASRRLPTGSLPISKSTSRSTTGATP
jgi:hypothetical protein